MALRSGVPRRFFSTFPFTSQSTAAATSASVQQPAPVPSTTLFVSGLNKRTSSDQLKETFSNFGKVVQAFVVTDRASGYSKGFGFVKYSTMEEAEEGIKGMDGQNMHVQDFLQSNQLSQQTHQPAINYPHLNIPWTFIKVPNNA